MAIDVRDRAIVQPEAASRRDAWPPNGGRPGSDLEFMRTHHLDPHWDYDDPTQVLPPGVDEQLRRDFFMNNARTVYGG